MTMRTPDYSALVARQREHFLSGVTCPAARRKERLKAVKAFFTENHDELCEALWKYLRRNVTDADLMDVAYSVLYHGARIDPGVRYPPYSTHTTERKIEGKLMP